MRIFLETANLREHSEASVPGVLDGVTANPSLAAKGGRPFLGRLDDTGHVGMDLVRDFVEICRNSGYKTQMLATSIRNPLHVIDAPRRRPT